MSFSALSPLHGTDAWTGNEQRAPPTTFENQEESLRPKLRPNVIYLMATLGFLCFFIALKGPPLYTDVQYYLGTPERNAKVLLTGSTRLALLSQNKQVVLAYQRGDAPALYPGSHNNQQ